MGAGSYLRDAVEGGRSLLHHQTDPGRGGTGDVSGGEWREGNHQGNYAIQHSFTNIYILHPIVTTFGIACTNLLCGLLSDSIQFCMSVSVDTIFI